jgi:hypothetical protein
MTYKEALEEHKRMIEFRDKHYTDISKSAKPPKEKETSEFHFFET